jgi:murein DD-endopeptidase MepM/ murein hydrolase activator NlpD
VRSIGPGRVAYVGLIAGKPVVAIQHASGLRSTYEPVVAEVTVGTQVHGGDRIGVVADPRAPGARLGHCSARCLHLGLRSQGVYIDPMLLLHSRAILLPLGQVV